LKRPAIPFNGQRARFQYPRYQEVEGPDRYAGGPAKWPTTRSRRSERELDIEKEVEDARSRSSFHNRPLSEVIDHLGKLTAVNLHLDEKGLDEGRRSRRGHAGHDRTCRADVMLKSGFESDSRTAPFELRNQERSLDDHPASNCETARIFPRTYDVADPG